jgi:hypothetical protein
MLKQFLRYFVLWILLLLLVEINCQMKPLRRRFHTATLIDGKLYILGGFIDNKDAEKNFFYLDASVEFSTQNLLWQDLSGINIVPPHYQATSVKGGANNKTLFLYGGDNEMASLVYTFDPQSNLWTIPEISEIPGVHPILRRFLLKGIIDNNGKMYLWCGSVNDRGIVNDMLILDTINLSWGQGSLISTPIPRLLYGAVLLPSRKIIYMGKQEILVMLILFTISYFIMLFYYLGGYSGKSLTLNEV